eukprot:10485280-Ditylum_brightwellii.AAC.1
MFSGTLIQGKPPIFIGLYVDNFVYFFPSNTVEKEFKQALVAQGILVDFMDTVKWLIGIKMLHPHQEPHPIDQDFRTTLSLPTPTYPQNITNCTNLGLAA